MCRGAHSVVGVSVRGRRGRRPSRRCACQAVGGVIGVFVRPAIIKDLLFDLVRRIVRAGEAACGGRHLRDAAQRVVRERVRLAVRRKVADDVTDAVIGIGSGGAHVIGCNIGSHSFKNHLFLSKGDLYQQRQCNSTMKATVFAVRPFSA